MAKNKKARKKGRKTKKREKKGEDKKSRKMGEGKIKRLQPSLIVSLKD
jgi:hypothetical protein